MDERYEQIRMLADQLNQLFADPQPGLATWNWFVSDKIKRLAEAAGYEVQAFANSELED